MPRLLLSCIPSQKFFLVFFELFLLLLPHLHLFISLQHVIFSHFLLFFYQLHVFKIFSHHPLHCLIDLITLFAILFICFLALSFFDLNLLLHFVLDMQHFFSDFVHFGSFDGVAAFFVSKHLYLNLRILFQLPLLLELCFSHLRVPHLSHLSIFNLKFQFFYIIAL